MPRFTASRTRTPALLLSLVLLVAFAAELHAARISDRGIVRSGRAGVYTPNNAGDPDSPGSTGPAPGQIITPVGAWTGTGSRSSRTEMMGTSSGSDWKWRLQVTLRAGWKIYFR